MKILKILPSIFAISFSSSAYHVLAEDIIYSQKPSNIRKSSTAENISDDLKAKFIIKTVDKDQEFIEQKYWNLTFNCGNRAELAINSPALLRKIKDITLFSNPQESAISIATSDGSSYTPIRPLFIRKKDGSGYKNEIIKEDCVASPYYKANASGHLKAQLIFQENITVNFSKTVVKVATLVAPLYSGPHGALLANFVSPAANAAAGKTDDLLNELLNNEYFPVIDAIPINPEKHSKIIFSTSTSDKEQEILQLNFNLIDSLLTKDGKMPILQNRKNLRSSLGDLRGRRISTQYASTYIEKKSIPNAESADNFCIDTLSALEQKGFNALDSALLTFSELELKGWNDKQNLRNSDFNQCEERLQTALEKTPSYKDAIQTTGILLAPINKKNLSSILEALKGTIESSQTSTIWSSNVQIVNNSGNSLIESNFNAKNGNKTYLTDDQTNDIFISISKSSLIFNEQKNCLTPTGDNLALLHSNCFFTKNPDGTSTPINIRVELTGPRTNQNIQIKSIVFTDI